jgi:hypothetical protein
VVGWLFAVLMFLAVTLACSAILLLGIVDAIGIVAGRKMR